MDLKKLQPSIDALNAEIAKLTSARDTLQGLVEVMPKAIVPIKKEKPTTSTARSAAQRKRWAEAKRLQRAAAKKGTK